MKADIRMIDFAHVIKTEDGRLDHGYRTGIMNLITCLEKFENFSVKDYRDYLLDVFPESYGQLPTYVKTPKTTNSSNRHRPKTTLPLPHNPTFP